MRALGVTGSEASVPYIPQAMLSPAPPVGAPQCKYMAVWQNNLPGPTFPGGESFQGSQSLIAVVAPHMAPMHEQYITTWAKGYGRVRGFWKLVRFCPNDGQSGEVVATWTGDLASSEDVPAAPPAAPPVPTAPALLPYQAAAGAGLGVFALLALGGYFLFVRKRRG